MAQVKNYQTVLPDIFSRTYHAIQAILLDREFNLDLSQPDSLDQSLIADVMGLSNYYVTNPKMASPWKNSGALRALLAYYHPLNQSRVYGVSCRAKLTHYFHNLTHIVEIGAGSGAASLGILSAHPGLQKVILTDASLEALKQAKRLFENAIDENYPRKIEYILADLKTDSIHRVIDNQPQDQTFAVFSYVLTEGFGRDFFLQFLKKHQDLEGIAIFEPSTKEDGRFLMEIRALLLQNGYHIWAPCTHELDCPLLTHSATDWCHDRLPFFPPPWWPLLEHALPIKNKTVTTSYLFARKTPRAQIPPEVRVVGDPLYEKTKTRQMICRKSEREFISWFPSRLKIRHDEFDLARGDVFRNTESFFRSKKGSDNSPEYRLELEDILEIKKKLVSFKE